MRPGATTTDGYRWAIEDAVPSTADGPAHPGAHGAAPTALGAEPLSGPVLRPVADRNTGTLHLLASVGAVLAAGAVVALVPDAAEVGPGSLLVAVIALVAAINGHRAALAASGIGLLTMWLVVLPPRGSLRLESATDVWALAIFVASVALVVGVLHQVDRTRREDTEAEVRAVDDLYHRALEAVSDGMIIEHAVRDESGHIVDFEIDYANPATVDGMGRGPEELVGTRILEDYPAVAGSPLFDLLVGVVETGQSATIDHYAYPIEVDGVTTNAVYLLSIAKLGDGLVSTFRDVTNREEQAAALAATSAQLEAAQHVAGLGSWEWAAGTEDLQWSRGMYRITGLDPADGPQPFSETDLVTDPAERAQLSAAWARSTRSLAPFEVELTFTRPGGQKRAVVLRGDPIVGDDGDLSGMRGTLQDVTDWREAQRREAGLQLELERGRLQAEHDDQLRRLVEANVIGVATGDPETVLTANDRFLATVGATEDDLSAGRLRWRDMTPAEWQEADDRAAAVARRTGTIPAYEKEFTRMDGSRVPILFGGARSSEEPIRWTAFVVDLSERKAIEQRLLDAVTERNRLLDAEHSARQDAEAASEALFNMAVTLQESLLPPSLPPIDGAEAVARYRAAGSGTQVGGDFYDVMAIGPDTWAVFIGDVCGTGVHAARLTATARHTLRAAANHSDSVVEPLRWLNDALYTDVNRGDDFCTCCFGTLTRGPKGFTYRFALGGHPLPIVVATDGSARLEGRPGTVLGPFARPRLEEHTTTLGPGEMLLLYTDGLTDAPGALGLSGAELLELATHSRAETASATADAILAEIDRRRAGAAHEDDTALLLVRVADRQADAPSSQPTDVRSPGSDQLDRQPVGSEHRSN